MRLKPLPSPPADLQDLRVARAAIPLVPGDEFDCCARILNRLAIDEREEARRWLTLLRALGLVEEGDRGFSRTRDDAERDELGRRFHENVYGAREAYDALEDETPQPVEDVFDAIEDIVPAWERDKYRGTWRDVWRDRTADLLDWFVLLGLAEHEGDGYVRSGFEDQDRIRDR